MGFSDPAGTGNGLERPPPQDGPGGTRPTDVATARVYYLMTDVCRGLLAAGVAGIVCLGIGGRLAMRLSASINPEAAGAVTENGNAIGDITFAGTLELLVFVGVMGGFAAGVVWVLVRDWLPMRTLPRVVLAALLAAVTGSSAVVDSGNFDFDLVDPPWLHAAMFVSLVGITGAATAGIDRALEGRLPAGDAAVAVFGGVAGLALVIAGPFLIGYFFVAGAAQRGAAPWGAGLGLTVVAVATFWNWAKYYSTGHLSVVARTRRHRALGVGGVVLFALLGCVHLSGQVADIL